MEREGTIDLRFDTPKEIPTCLRFCLRLLGLWSGNDAYENERPSIYSQTEENHNTLIAMRDFTSDANEERQTLLVNSSRGTGTKVTKTFRTLDQFIWVAIPLYFVIQISYDFAVNMVELFGDATKTIHLISYSTFILQLAAIQIICLSARFNIWRYKVSKKTGVPILGSEYHREMVQHVRYPKLVSSQYKTLLLLSIWPIINIILIIYTFLTIDDIGCYLFFYSISRFTECVAFLQYACFSYVFLILRKAFEARLKALPEHAESIQNNFHQDKCKATLCHAYLEYRKFRNLVGGWMTFVMAVGVLGITTQLSYYYYYHQSGNSAQIKTKMTTYSIMIWSQKLMFIVQPMFVFGGINVDYLWQDLKRRVTEQLGTPQTVGHTKNIIQYMDIINISPQWIIPTLGFCLVSVYLGFHLPNQNIQFWYGLCGHDSNQTDSLF